MKLRHNKHPPQHPICRPKGAFLNAGMIQYTWQSESSVGQEGKRYIKVLESCLVSLFVVLRVFEVKSKWTPQG